MSDSASRRPTVAQVVLGLFVVWQLVFILATNLLGLFPHGQPEKDELTDSRVVPADEVRSGAVQDAVEMASLLTSRWAQLTGQYQAWWLFAPDFPTQATFPLVELRWEDAGPPAGALAACAALGVDIDLGRAALWSAGKPVSAVRLPSVFEPAEPLHYFRPPCSRDRQFHYEIRMGLILVTWSEENFAQFPEEWRDAIRERVRRQWKSMRAYLRWRLHEFQREHPDVPAPNEVVLNIRIFLTPRQGQEPWYYRIIERPLARWRPGTEPPSGYLPVEAYDFATQRFEKLRVEE
jgi:hypothetical protein